MLQAEKVLDDLSIRDILCFVPEGFFGTLTIFISGLSAGPSRSMDIFAGKLTCEFRYNVGYSIMLGVARVVARIWTAGVLARGTSVRAQSWLEAQASYFFHVTEIRYELNTRRSDWTIVDPSPWEENTFWTRFHLNLKKKTLKQSFLYEEAIHKTSSLPSVRLKKWIRISSSTRECSWIYF